MNYTRLQELVDHLALLNEEFHAYHAKDANGEYLQPFFVREREELRQAFIEAFPKKKYKTFMDARLGLGDAAEVIIDKWRLVKQELVDNWNTRKAEVEHEITRLSVELHVETSTEWVFWDAYSGHDYSTQGYGKNRYAKAAAEAKADKARALGLDVKVVESLQRKGTGHIYCSGATLKYEIFVKTTELGLVVLKNKPEQDIREWVRLCWKRGTNPRVFFPWLPHGYEESEGLDFFGNETRSLESEAVAA